jgi:hypothetical protein
MNVQLYKNKFIKCRRLGKNAGGFEKYFSSRTLSSEMQMQTTKAKRT